jgi:hypothetical protein
MPRALVCNDSNVCGDERCALPAAVVDSAGSAAHRRRRRTGHGTRTSLRPATATAAAAPEGLGDGPPRMFAGVTQTAAISSMQEHSASSMHRCEELRPRAAAPLGGIAFWARRQLMRGCRACGCVGMTVLVRKCHR